MKKWLLFLFCFSALTGNFTGFYHVDFNKVPDHSWILPGEYKKYMSGRLMPILLYKYLPAPAGGPLIISHLTLMSPYFVFGFPDTVVNALSTFYGITSNKKEALFEKAKNGSLDCSIQTFPAFIIRNDPFAKQTYFNLFFHDVLRIWLNKQSGDVQREIQAALFDALGVTHGPAPAFPFNALGAVNVNYHDNRYSPDNAHIYIDQAGVPTAWVVAGLPGTQHAIASLCIFCNDDATQNIFPTLISHALKGKTDSKEVELSDDDVYAIAVLFNSFVKKTITTNLELPETVLPVLKKMFNVLKEAYNHVATEKIIAQQSLENLAESLQTLQKLSKK